MDLLLEHECLPKIAEVQWSQHETRFWWPERQASPIESPKIPHFSKPFVVEASFQRSILLPVSRRCGKTTCFFLGVVLLDAVHSCRLCRLQMKRLPRDEVVAQQPMLGFATDQACSIREVQLIKGI